MRRLLLLLPFALAACRADGTLPSPSGQRPGTILYYADPVRITAPASWPAGQPFQVTVVTYANGCVTRGDTQVDVRGLSADIKVFDRDDDLNPAALCLASLHELSHQTTLLVSSPGTAKIRVHGRSEPDNKPHTVTVTVQIDAAPFPTG
ncbi:MAG TPA: hypothetical protein VFE05_15990 [Longimicrobiaceae bacterium]|jgi:hypothetical protein|nr:hypothetical protein [Longimicrobiaceae bacterium]